MGRTGGQKGAKGHYRATGTCRPLAPAAILSVCHFLHDLLIYENDLDQTFRMEDIKPLVYSECIWSRHNSSCIAGTSMLADVFTGDAQSVMEEEG